MQRRKTTVGHLHPGVQANTLTTYAELRTRFLLEGPGVSPEITGGSYSLDALQTCEEVFQPRLRAGVEAFHLERNVESLTAALRLQLANEQEGSTKAKGFKPLTVFPIGGDLYVLDGHCRLQAYRQAQWERKVPVVLFRASPGESRSEHFERAVDAAKRFNEDGKLGLSPKENKQAAWFKLIRNSKLPAEERQSINRLALSISGVKRSTVHNMNQLLQGGLPGFPSLDLSSFTWAQVEWIRRNGPDGMMEQDDTAIVSDLRRWLAGTRLKKHLKRPDLLWRAMREEFPKETLEKFMQTVREVGLAKDWEIEDWDY